MALKDVANLTKEERNVYVNHILEDLDALDLMLNNTQFDSEDIHIGVEQEFCLINYNLRPMMRNTEILKVLNDDHFTTELAKFNLEINLDPIRFQNACFSEYENELIRLLTRVNKIAHKKGGKVILTGILPSIREKDTEIENITPMPRYHTLNNVMTRIRGKDFRFNIQGIDELISKANSVLYESCNTSFQVHLQIDPARFNEIYNWAQFISAPVLASAANSPLFLGKRLWRETRIALFLQSTDIRNQSNTFRDERPRVFFGTDWERNGINGHYRESLSRFKILMCKEIESSSLNLLKNGEIPKLSALQLHNGTVYKWNRPCYGITNGMPHIRIENRYLPSGPSITDEIANSAFWIGLMNGMPKKYENIHEQIHFDDVKNNFIKAARSGLSAQFKWVGYNSIPAKDLILKELLPIAESGLKKAGINESDINKYLETIDQRVRKEMTGAQWMLNSFSELRKESNLDETLAAITEAIYQRQKSGMPVHKWKLARFEESGEWSNKYMYMHQVMTRDLITVGKDEPLEFIKNIMLWSNIRHVPVEDDNGALLGMISSEILLNVYSQKVQDPSKRYTAEDIMERDPRTVEANTHTIDAIKIMGDNELSCVPVLKDGKLVGLFTERDFIKFSKYVFEDLKLHTKEENK